MSGFGTMAQGDPASVGHDQHGDAGSGLGLARPWWHFGVALAPPEQPGCHLRHEIAAQPEALRRTEAALRGLALPAPVAAARRLLVLADGGALHAATAAQGWIEQLSGLPCEVAPARAWGDRCGLLLPGTLGVLVSRSGEGAGALAAQAALRGLGVPTVAVTGAPRATLARAALLCCPAAAGPQRGLIATAGFTAPLLALLRLAGMLGAGRAAIDAEAMRQAARALAEAPLACALAEAAEARLAAVGARIARAGGAIVAGAGWSAALAEAAAENLCRLARLPAEAMPVSAPGHGAGVGAGVPVLLLASASADLAAVLAFAEAARARGAPVVALAEAACSPRLDAVAADVVALPGRGLAQIFAQAVALQMIAYHAALALGHEPDRPSAGPGTAQG